MRNREIEKGVEAIRRFNRFYTKQIGVLNEGFLRSRFSLAEVRILFELAHRGESTATIIGQELGIDPGYMSRILCGFERQGLIAKSQCTEDRRQRILCLTEAGSEEFAKLNSRAHNHVERMIRGLTGEDRERLAEAIHTIENVLGASPEKSAPYILRPHQPGDIGWIIHRHGVIYSEEHGWDETFEALVAEILSEFIKHYDPRWERSWIAEMDGEVVGSVFAKKKSDDVAKLHLLLVEPTARGMGIGTRLVDECINFTRRIGYHRLTRWTNDTLHAARRIYQRAGFQLMMEEKHHSFGHDLVGQNWELELQTAKGVKEQVQ